jgi:hypothetical protein
MLRLEPFDINEINEYLGKGLRETLLAAIALGGIPEYLKQVYYRFIDAKRADIDAGKFVANPSTGINRQDFNKLMGFSFERWCRRNEALIAFSSTIPGINVTRLKPL